MQGQADLGDSRVLEQLLATIERLPRMLARALADVEAEAAPRMARIGRALDSAQDDVRAAERALEHADDEDAGAYEDRLEEARDRLRALESAAAEVRDALASYKAAAREIRELERRELAGGRAFLSERLRAVGEINAHRLTNVAVGHGHVPSVEVPASPATRPAVAQTEIEVLIDQELASNSDLADVSGDYAGIFERFAGSGDSSRMFEETIEHSADAYRRQHPEADLTVFSDGKVNFLFDATHERTVMVWGLSEPAAPGSRDRAYHKGYPTAGDGLDKGHAWSHAQGGREGGPNYFRQARALNQGRSASGRLWRAVERYLGSEPGVPAFVKLNYTDESDCPADIEYGLCPSGGTARAVRFRNS